VRIYERTLQRMENDACVIQDRLPTAIRQRDASRPSAKVHFDDWHVGAVQIDEGEWFQTIHPLWEATSKDLSSFEWPDMRDPTRWKGLAQQAEQLAKEGRRVFLILGPDAGYLLSSVHVVQKDVPPENILAMCDEALTAGCYPLQ